MAELAETMDQAVKVMVDKEGKYLTFMLANEEYGIGILKVKEIIGLMPITSVPQTPDFVKGVINLRGKVIPVIDLRLKFGMEEIKYSERTCIIVVEIAAESGDFLIGTVVDTVSEVLNIKGEDVEATPAFGSKLNTKYILGLAKVEGGVKILLDIDQVLIGEGFEIMSSLKEESPVMPSETTAEQAVATPEETVAASDKTMPASEEVNESKL